MTDKEILVGKLQTFKKYGFIDSITFFELDFEAFKQKVCECIDELIESVENDASITQMKQVMKPYIQHLRSLSITETEEREYATFVYYELSQVVSVDLAFTLNTVLYGWVLTALTTNPFAKKKKWLDTVNVTKTIDNTCAKCKCCMVTRIIDYPKREGEQEEKIVDMRAIVNCKVCGEMNLILITEKGDLAHSYDYYIREEIPENWNEERAQQRMQQIMYWNN